MVHGKERENRSAKKLLIALRNFVQGEGAAPFVLTDGRIAERFGWTFDQLDQQDESRVMIAIQMMNIHDIYERVMRAVMSHNTDSISEDDMKIWQLVTDVGTEHEVIEDAGSKSKNNN